MLKTANAYLLDFWFEPDWHNKKPSTKINDAITTEEIESVNAKTNTITIMLKTGSDFITHYNSFKIRSNNISHLPIIMSSEKRSTLLKALLLNEYRNCSSSINRLIPIDKASMF